MKKIVIYLLSIIILSSCTKEVEIDIPGYEDKLVVDGFIETNAPPFVLLSHTNDIYSPTNLEAYLNGFISGAIVTVNDGTTTFTLDEICTDNLPPGTEDYAANLFGIPVEELANYHLCAYTSMDLSLLGEVGKTYYLSVTYGSKTYTSSTTIVEPTPLVNTFWKPDNDETEYGYSWAKLTDPAGQYDAYRWEVRYISEPFFTKTFSPVFDDQFFDGLSFEFAYENPMSFDDDNWPDDKRGYYKMGDTIVIKFSKMDRYVFEFLEKKYTQIYTAGNPFATPTNIPSNIEGGALGLWAGYSPWYDTLICVE